ncbi:PIG-L family deacetylase [Hymenobacter sp. BT635]|uniref:PIG-L family deacetylase n=1 Tax=Hymenobacter nitidus TaxID=2880929 RepID=A0ABS8ABD8_9BACT|nr:PIG-L family deacetylase [Hymenobacter nitidus]MCB2377702.1 PIG-L family deacetylase [Hymenobacter nitidus]
MRLIRFRAAALLALLITNYSLLIGSAQAQAPKTYTSSEILLGLKKLNVLGSVLYVAAHPDDENTRLIAYMANGRLLETGYLSCTRGDGGQNLIGPELREQLGVIRTQELLAARRIDGGRQFFTRANDFGFSKTAEETFTIWDKEQVLSDMVWVIRQRRPDVLITRFPPDARAGHGHHTASAILAAEAFDAAGDPKRFPEQLKYVQVWQPKRLFWNTGSFFVKPGENMDGYLRLDAGGYNPLLGQSYGEIAARSRSQHKSQGFGSAATRGEALEYLQQVKGDKASKDPFEGIDQSWNRVPGGAAIGKMIDEVIRKYDAGNPSASVAGLLKVRGALNSLPNDKFWGGERVATVENLIKACLGLYIEAVAVEPSFSAVALVPASRNGYNPKYSVSYEVVERSNVPLKLNRRGAYVAPYVQPMGKPALIDSEDLNISMKPNEKLNGTLEVGGEFTNALASQPYWLTDVSTTGMYSVQQQDKIGKPENEAVATVDFQFEVYGESISFTVPVQYKSTDPVEGEKYRPLTVVPPVAVNIGGRAYVFADNTPKTIPVTLRTGRAGVKGSLALTLPAGWKAQPATASFDLTAKDAEQTVFFQVQPGPGAAEGKSEVKAVATVDGKQYSRGYQAIQYNHIPTQTLFPEAVAPLVKLDLKRKGQEIGYLMGAGDDVPDALRQIGYNVTLLKPEDINADYLRRFDAVVLGVRAYNTVSQLRNLQPNLLKYVENGGNVVVQYVVNRGTVLPEIGPYPLKLSSDRVTVENAAVTFLNPKQPLLNMPNKITARDFEGWQQEQGLYYPSSWDPKYQTVISSHDPGETAKEGAILVADYGKGHYIYTGLSFFRELPAGVPGAYRLLTNMVSLGK